jgi:hypothetical protein
LLALNHAGCISLQRSSSGSAANDSTDTHEKITRVRWVRIHGAENEAAPPIMRLPGSKGANGIGSTALTLTCDLVSEGIPNLVLTLVHCDHNWQPTASIFVQDVMHLRTADLDISRSPMGVRQYDYTVSATFPRADASLRIQYSGNYLARLVDYYDNARVLAEARFFVVDSKAAVDVAIYSDLYQSAQTEVIQRGLKVQVGAETATDLFSSQVNAIALYHSGEWMRPMLATAENFMAENKPGEAWARWSSYVGGRALAEFGNLPSGNEHRLLDLTDLGLFPPTNGIVTTPLSDLPRREFYQYDNNGVAITRLIPSQDQDYVTFEFRLNLGGSEVKQDICVVGTFNNWTPSAEWRMSFDRRSGLYIVRGLIRRALHEYEYVSGDWDEDAQTLRHADASLIEGNSTMTSDPYYAFVYYRDPTAGGYDRIIGGGIGWSGSVR